MDLLLKGLINFVSKNIGLSRREYSYHALKDHLQVDKTSRIS